VITQTAQESQKLNKPNKQKTCWSGKYRKRTEGDTRKGTIAVSIYFHQLFKQGIDVDYKQIGCGKILNN